jgi:hypothetical protein
MLVGGAETMIDQLRHLLAMSEHDNVTIQIVPFSAGAWGRWAALRSFSSSMIHRTPAACTDYGAGSETVRRRRSDSGPRTGRISGEDQDGVQHLEER